MSDATWNPAGEARIRTDGSDIKAAIERVRPPIIPTEQVRADQIKILDPIWNHGAFRRVVAIARRDIASPRLWIGVESDEGYGTVVEPDDLVLRQAAPASPVVTEEMRRRGAFALASMDLNVHPQLANERQGKPFSFGELADVCLEAPLASQENTGGEG